ncbi:hypothetical protein EJB05_12195, partial [Eragrostis curvula]
MSKDGFVISFSEEDRINISSGTLTLDFDGGSSSMTSSAFARRCSLYGCTVRWRKIGATAPEEEKETYDTATTRSRTCGFDPWWNVRRKTAGWCSETYSFPFLALGDDSSITVDDNRGDPLYKHFFRPQVAPHLSFIGLPSKVGCQHPIRTNPAPVHSRNDLRCERPLLRIEARGTPRRYTHCLNHNQFDYEDWLAKQCGSHIKSKSKSVESRCMLKFARRCIAQRPTERSGTITICFNKQTKDFKTYI